MAKSTDAFWTSLLDRLALAFQPIVNIHSGACPGYAVSIENTGQADSEPLSGLFDRAHGEGRLAFFQGWLLRKAMAQLGTLSRDSRAVLFFDLDARLLADENEDVDALTEVLTHDGIPACVKTGVVIGLQPPIDSLPMIPRWLHRLRQDGLRIAAGGFGEGAAGLRLLYDWRPEYITLDRFFIDRLDGDAEKRMLATCLVAAAHQLGSLVIADDVRREDEFHECRKLGCDLVKGLLIQPPVRDTTRLANQYAVVAQWCECDRRKVGHLETSLLESEIEAIPPIRYDAPMTDILDAFKNHITRTFFPVVDAAGEPLGIIRESSIKAFIYSRYGRFVLENQALKKNIDEFITRVPRMDVHMPIDHILDLFSGNAPLEGILVTREMRYAGFLNAQSMLKILNEKKLALARDQNPLSNLPGNNCIFAYISQALRDVSDNYSLVYFDFDNFKAYNDKYGFRQGDRVILLFAEMLKAFDPSRDRFVGHVGGDDFFMGVKGRPPETVISDVRTIAGEFKTSVESFYPKEALDKGCIQARDRDGQLKCFPLMTVSSVILNLPKDVHRIYSPEEIGVFIAGMKKKAKQSPGRLSAASLVHVDWQSPEVNPPTD